MLPILGKSRRKVFSGLLLLLVLLATFYGAQLLARQKGPARAEGLATFGQIAAVTGGELLLLNPPPSMMYLPSVMNQ
jgi:hypothetical protein